MNKTDNQRLKVLFLCTGNSCRSQMAEGWARHLLADYVDPYSAGIRSHGLDPMAVRVMHESNARIDGQQSKKLDQIGQTEFDLVITVCSNAEKSCPGFSGAPQVLHQSFDDPPKLAEGAANEQEALEHYRRVRDQIRRFVETLPDRLNFGPSNVS